MTAPTVRRIPGESGTWVFLFGDMVVFGVFFVTFMVERAKAPEVFDIARKTLHVGVGVTNTLVLLTSSLFVVIALGAIRSGMKSIATKALYAAIGCGLAFIGLKVFEYVALASAGHGPGANHLLKSVERLRHGVPPRPRDPRYRGHRGRRQTNPAIFSAFRTARAVALEIAYWALALSRCHCAGTSTSATSTSTPELVRGQRNWNRSSRWATRIGRRVRRCRLHHHQRDPLVVLTIVDGRRRGFAGPCCFGHQLLHQLRVRIRLLLRPSSASAGNS